MSIRPNERYNFAPMNIPFTVINWQELPPQNKPGTNGESIARTITHPGLRIRMVEYTPGYLADHWCQKGHIIHCLKGSFTSELESGESFILKAGMSYVVSDDASSHRSTTTEGCSLLIIDGDFLNSGM